MRAKKKKKKREVQKHVNLVDLVESFLTNILLQNLASIQKRTSGYEPSKV